MTLPAVVSPVANPPPDWEPPPGLEGEVTVIAALRPYAPSPGWWTAVPAPVGKGPAIRTGAEAALRLKPPAVAFCDADAYDAPDILRVVRGAVQAPAVYAIRSRSGHRSPLRRGLHQAVKNHLSPRGLDTQSPLKAFRADVLSALLGVSPDLYRGRYEFDLRVARALTSWGIEPARFPADEAPGSGGPSGVRLRDLLLCARAHLFPDPPPPLLPPQTGPPLGGIGSEG